MKRHKLISGIRSMGFKLILLGLCFFAAITHQKGQSNAFTILPDKTEYLCTDTLILEANPTYRPGLKIITTVDINVTTGNSLQIYEGTLLFDDLLSPEIFDSCAIVNDDTIFTYTINKIKPNTQYKFQWIDANKGSKYQVKVWDNGDQKFIIDETFNSDLNATSKWYTINASSITGVGEFYIKNSTTLSMAIENEGNGFAKLYPTKLIYTSDAKKADPIEIGYTWDGENNLQQTPINSVSFSFPIANATPNDNMTEMCEGDTIQLDGDPATGGDGNYVYSWSTSSVLTEIEQNDIANPKAFPKSSGLPYERIKFILEVTDGGGLGCSDKDEYILNLMQQPVIENLVTNAPFCNVNNSGNSGTTGTIDFEINGGTPQYFCEWKYDYETFYPQNTEYENMLNEKLDASYDSYKLRVFDDNKCYSEEVPFSIPLPEEIEYIASQGTTDNYCFGDALGEIEISGLIGGTKPFTYYLLDNNFEIDSLKGNGADVKLTNISGGTYTVRVKDSKGCYEDYDEEFNFYSAPELKLESFDVGTTEPFIYECEGQGVGQIGFDFSNLGGTPYDNPPEYALAAFEAGEDPVYQRYPSGIITDLPAGTYYVRVMDKNGCTAQFVSSKANNTIGISNYYTQLEFVEYDEATFEVIDNNLCYGDEKSEIRVSVKNPYKLSNIKYTLVDESTDNIIETQIQQAYDDVLDEPEESLKQVSFTNIGAGTYKIIAEYENAGCPIQQTGIVISEPEEIVISQQAIHKDVAGCHGDSTGSITVSYTGGTPEYTFKLTNDESPLEPETIKNVKSNQLIEFKDLWAGFWTLEVIDAGGCQPSGANITEEIEIEEPDLITFEDTIVHIETCYGNKEGSIEFRNMEGGTPPYAYKYFENGKFILSSIQTGLAGRDDCELQIRDANNCFSDTIERVINQPPELILRPVNEWDIKHNDTCAGMEIGAVTLVATGGNDTLFYSLNDTILSGPLFGTDKSSHTFTGLPAGTYTPKVTDENDCPANNIPKVTITEPAPIDFKSLTVKDVEDCFGDSTGSVIITDKGGPSKNYAPEFYLTMKQPVYNILAPSNSGTIENLPGGEYLVQIKNKYYTACASEEKAITIAQPDSLEVETTITDIEKCFGDNTGKIAISASGGTPDYLYSINGGNSLSDTSTHLNLPGDEYIIWVQDAHKCTFKDTIDLGQPDKLQFADDAYLVSPGDKQVDPGNTYEIPFASTDAAISIYDPIGGTPYEVGGETLYQFFKGNAPQYQDNGSFTNLTKGTYSFKILDEKGCRLDTTIILVEAPKFKFTLVPNDVTGCSNNSNGSVSIMFDADSGDPEGDLLYSLDKGEYVLLPSNRTISGLEARTYEIDITDEVGDYIFTETFPIRAPDPLVLDSAYVSTKLKCFGDENAVITVIAHGGARMSGSTPYTYSLEIEGETKDYPDSVISDLSADLYTVLVTDNNDCSVQETIKITEPTKLKLGQHKKTDITSCYGYRDGKIVMSASGGEAPYRYSLNGKSFPYSDTITNLVGDERYTLAVMDKNGCIDIGKVDSLKQPAQIQFYVRQQNMTCYKERDGEISIDTLTGGRPNFTLILALGGEIESFTNVPRNKVASNIFTDLLPKTYKLSIIDTSGCFETRSVTLTEPPKLRIDTVITISPRCDKEPQSGNIFIRAKGGYLPYNFFLYARGDTSSTSERLYNIDESKIDSSVRNKFCDQEFGEYCAVEPGYYRIEIRDDENCTVDSAFQVLPSRFSCLEIFNAFSPNNDNINDTWKIKRLDEYPEATVKIFDSWGKLLHTFSRNDDAWDGRYKNKEMPVDTYYYIIDPGSEYEKYTGALYLLR